MRGIVLYSVAKQGNKGLVTFERACREMNEKYQGTLCLTTSADKVLLPLNQLFNNLHNIQEVVVIRNRLCVKTASQSYTVAAQAQKGLHVALAEQFILTPTGAQIYKEAIKLNEIAEKQSSPETKHLVYTSTITETLEEARARLREEYTEEEIEDMGVDIDSDTSIYDFLSDSNNTWFEDEQANLPKEKLDIVAVATLGLWNGKRSAYKEYAHTSISELLGHMPINNGDFECFVQGVDLKCIQTHHDGRNIIVYRELTDLKRWNTLKNKIYNQAEWSLKELQSCTRGLGDRVRKIYGW